MIISSILSLVAINCGFYLNDTLVDSYHYDDSEFSVNGNAVSIDYGSSEQLFINIGNGYEDLAYGNFVNFYFDEYPIRATSNSNNYNRVRIELVFEENGSNYSGFIDVSSHDYWHNFGVSANSFIGENQQGVNCSVTPLYYMYEYHDYQYTWGSGKETNLYPVSGTYLANDIRVNDSDYSNRVFKLGLHIEYKQSGVLLTASDEQYYYQQGFNNGVQQNEDYYQNQVIPQLESEYNSEISSAYQEGYSAGYTEADSTDSQMNTIFTGILSIGLLPINMFLNMLNWEIFGINVGAFVSATLSVLIIVLIFRFIFKGKASE